MPWIIGGACMIVSVQSVYVLHAPPLLKVKENK